MQGEMQLTLEVARQAGDLLRRMQSQVRAREKAPADLVTEADFASQQLIQSRLQAAYPQYAFVGEEGTETWPDPRGPSARGRWFWIVDPLDGTTNYVHGLDNYAVSIGLASPDGLQLGVVFDPVRQECFSAARDGAAQLNGQPIHPSAIERLDQALVATSFPPQVQKDSPEVARFLSVLCRAQSVRRMGSAALNLAYVACGRLDGYWASTVKMWDVAAAAVILQEAGGVLTGLRGEPFSADDPCFVAAATPSLHRQLLALM